MPKLPVGNPNLPENLGAIMASAGSFVRPSQNEAAKFAESRLSKASSRMPKNYGVDVRTLGTEHHIATLLNKRSLRDTSNANAVGHVIWNGKTGEIVDAQIVTEHRHGGASIASLLNDAWSYSRDNAVSGPLGGRSMTAAAWRMARSHNPTFPGFAEHHLSQEGHAVGIPVKDVTQEEYANTYNQISDVLEEEPSRIRFEAERIHPFVLQENNQMQTSNEEEWRSRKTAMERFMLPMRGREAAMRLPGATRVFEAFSDRVHQINPQSLATSYLSSFGDAENHIRVSSPSYGDADVSIPLPTGACSSCGGRGDNTLIAPLGRDALTNLVEGRPQSVSFTIDPDLSDNPAHSIVHPKSGHRRIAEIDFPSLKSVNIYDDAIVAKETCRECSGTGREINA